MKEAVDEGGGGRKKAVEERRGRRYKEGDFWGFWERVVEKIFTEEQRGKKAGGGG